MVRPDRDVTVKIAIRLTPKYLELFDDLRREDAQVAWSNRVSGVRENLGAYVSLYEDEARIGNAIGMAFFGADKFSELNDALKCASLQEQQDFVDHVASLSELEAEEFLVQFLGVEQDWGELEKSFEALSEDDKKKVAQEGIPFWLFFFSSFFNTVSLMVHGTKLTTLVPQAIAGDDAALLKAVQVDRMLVLHHPYFRERKRKAQEQREQAFLRKLLNQESKSVFQTKIRYPGLYMLFGILDTFRWLDDLRHEEILNIADQAGLDRFQNRIEDVNYLTKRLIEYKRWQKSTK